MVLSGEEDVRGVLQVILKDSFVSHGALHFHWFTRIQARCGAWVKVFFPVSLGEVFERVPKRVLQVLNVS